MIRGERHDPIAVPIALPDASSVAADMRIVELNDDTYGGPVVAHQRILLSKGGDGLVDDWSGRLAYANQPFSNMLACLRRAHEQWRAGKVRTVICLVPVRTDSAFFHDTLSADADIFLLQGRVKFLSTQGKPQHTPFSLMGVALGTTPEQRRQFAKSVPGRWLVRSAAVQEQLTA